MSESVQGSAAGGGGPPVEPPGSQPLEPGDSREFSLWLRRELQHRNSVSGRSSRRLAGKPPGETVSSPGSLMRHLELLSRLDRARRRLPAEYAEAIRLRQEEGLSLEEVGQRMGRGDAAAVWGRAILQLARLIEGPDADGGRGEGRTLDESLLESLVRFDEALRLGRVPLDRCGEDEGPPAAIRRCLLTLETFYPRSAAACEEPEEPQHEGHISRFELREFIGSGGFGVVYKAYDPVLGREVAVKTPRPQYLTDPQTARRFVREAQAAAKLDHPNVVPIYEAGLEGDVPFIAYAFCEGPTLSAWFRDQDGPLPNRLAAKIVDAVARAVEYSHQRGIIHRDIKPANILLFPQEAAGDPQFPYIPRLADLGLAKPLEPGGVEESISFEIAGTPSYMAPEQARGRPAGLGRASDVYSLGAVLYYLLTMRPPFAGVGWIETMKEVVEREPANPRLLNRAVDADLATICLKCLEKSPERRYPSAAALADDLHRYLCGEPIVARPASPIYRARRWCSRRPGVTALLGGVLLLTAGLGYSLTWNAYQSAMHREELRGQNAELRRTVAQLDAAVAVSERQRRIAEANEERANRLSYVSDLQAANVAMQHGDLRVAAAMLTRSEAETSDREFAWFYLRNKIQPPGEQISDEGQTIWSLTFSPNGHWMAIGGNEGRVTLFNAHGGYRKTLELDTGQREVNSVVFSPNSELLATAGDDGHIGLWSIPSGKLVRKIEAIPGALAFDVEFVDRGSKVIACGQSKDLTVWDVASGSLVRVLATPHERTIEALAVSLDGRRIATAGAEGIAAVIDSTGREPPQVLGDFDKTVATIGYASDGRVIVVATRGGDLRIYDAATSTEEFELNNPEGFTGLAVGKDGSFAVSDRGGIVHVIEQPQDQDDPVGQWRVRDHWAAHDREVSGLSFSPDGGLLISGDAGGQVCRWATDPVLEDRTFELPEQQPPHPQSICVGPTADRLFYAGFSGLRSLGVDGRLQSSSIIDSPLVVCRYGDDERTVIFGDRQGRIGLMPIDDVSALQWIPVSVAAPLDHVSAAGDMRLIAAVDTADDCVLFDRAKDEEVLRCRNVSRCDLTRDGRFLAVSRHGTDDLEVYATGSGDCVAVGRAHQSTINVLTFGDSGRLLLSAANDRIAVLWDTADWAPLATLLGHGDSVTAGAISPDGKTVVTGDHSGHIKLWLTADGSEIMELPPRASPVVSLHFALDGQTLFATTQDSQLHRFVAARDTQR